MGDIKYFRGPGPRRGRRETRPAPAPQAAPSPVPFVPLPTRWLTTTAGGRETRLVENPNVCEICHQGAHADTAHHDFTPDRASEAVARRLGWPIPSNTDYLL